MNIFQIANIDTLHRTTLIRQERIKKEGSPYYSYIMPVTAATASVAFDTQTQFPQARKYEPLDWLEVTNNDAVDLNIIINGTITLPIPAGTIKTIKNQAIWHVTLTNLDAAVATTLNKVVLTLQRMPLTVDDWARKQR